MKGEHLNCGHQTGNVSPAGPAPAPPAQEDRPMPRPNRPPRRRAAALTFLLVLFALAPLLFGRAGGGQSYSGSHSSGGGSHSSGSYSGGGSHSSGGGIDLFFIIYYLF